MPPVTDEHPINISGSSPLISQLLFNRGLSQPSQVELFIAADKRLAANPWLLPDTHQAVGRIYQALLSGEKIAIYGDFDVDGITGTALLIKGLTILGGETIPYIPHRLKEGHGLNTTALNALQRQGISLVITVDCGITGLSAAKKAKQEGLDLIITDHHAPLDELPLAIAVVNPKRSDSAYPLSELAGVGVAFKLLDALYQSMGREELLDEMLDLVALGTVADMMPLLGENRYLVKEGLKLLNTAPRPGIREMAALTGLNPGSLRSESISWVLGPRLNAAGRLEHAISSYKLLLTDSPDEAKELAIWLEEKNAERQRLTTRTLTKAREQILAKGVTPLLIASDQDYPAGIIGLVAGKLANEFYRPSIVIRIGEQFSTASCRSIPEFNIISALSECRSFLSRFGGHSQAAGFTLPTKNLPRLAEQLSDLATTQLTGLELRPRLDIDAEVSLSALSGNTFKSIQKLAPFGQGNPLPTFLSHQVKVADCRLMGNNGAHLKLKLEQDNIVWDAVAFSMGNRLSEVHSVMNIVYNMELDQWRGQERLRLNILDLAPVDKTG
ncbi:MAG: single-stranded-DNA-specific exonuclease RecJ [Dehalococcoidales bacterium]|nr:single-stranded-DNA-specific exonuclease RecJ [Dehalococcoidales bacterium]